MHSPVTARVTLRAWQTVAPLFCLIAVQSANAQDSAFPLPDLADLGRIRVVTVSKHPELAWRAGSAVTVLTSDDIRRSGATTIPEALRNVPGIDVARVNGSAWAIGARGARSQFAAKLLVLIDGRSVYTPVFGGVFWDVQDYLLPDLEQIEIVRGPGSSIWGANAVNGVINIVTKSASRTHGDLLQLGSGNGDRALVSARHGWAIDADTSARIYVKHLASAGTRLPSGADADDATQFTIAGFRLDHDPPGQANWTLQGDAYSGQNDFRVTLPSLSAPPLYQQTHTEGGAVSGGNLLGRWEKFLGGTSTLGWRTFLSFDQRSGAIFDTRVYTADTEFLHSFSVGPRHEIAWGATARHQEIRTRESWISFVPTRARLNLSSIFAQDSIALVPAALTLTAGVKLEHNNLTGLEPQPSVKLAWLPNERHTLWAGLARAVRIPAITEESTRVDVAAFPPGVRDPTLPAALRGTGNSELRSETLHAIDAGWRWQPDAQWSFDLSAYYNRYQNLIKVTNGPSYTQTAPVAARIYPLPEDNAESGRGFGAEFSAHWQARHNWRLTLGYAYTELKLQATTPDPFNFLRFARASPRSAVTLTSTLQPAHNWEFTTNWRHVGTVVAFQIPAYLDCDLRLAWRPSPQWEIALIGKNLLDPQHPEIKPSLAGPATEIPRTFELRITLARP